MDSLILFRLDLLQFLIGLDHIFPLFVLITFDNIIAGHFFVKVPAEELAFALTFPQIREAHEIYKKHCFFQDFIGQCEDRRQDRIGLCNLPYQTLEHETDILCTAYELYEKLEDSNVSYHVTMENVIDAIEKQILNGELRLHTEPAPRVVLVMEDGIVTASYTNAPFIQAEVIKLDKE